MICFHSLPPAALSLVTVWEEHWDSRGALARTAPLLYRGLWLQRARCLYTTACPPHHIQQTVDVKVHCHRRSILWSLRKIQSVLLDLLLTFSLSNFQIHLTLITIWVLVSPGEVWSFFFFRSFLCNLNFVFQVFFICLCPCKPLIYFHNLLCHQNSDKLYHEGIYQWKKSIWYTSEKLATSISQWNGNYWKTEHVSYFVSLN